MEQLNWAVIEYNFNEHLYEGAFSLKTEKGITILSFAYDVIYNKRKEMFILRALTTQGIDGLTLLKKLRLNAIFSGNKALALQIEETIKSVNGNDSYLLELVKIHEPIRKRVNQSIAKAFESLDENLMNPQFKLAMQQVKLDSLN